MPDNQAIYQQAAARQTVLQQLASSATPGTGGLGGGASVESTYASSIPSPGGSAAATTIEGSWANYQDWNNTQAPAYVHQLQSILADMQGGLG